MGAVLAVVAFGGFQGARAWWAWRGIERVEFDTAEARAQLPFVPLGTDEPSPEPVEDATPTPTYEVVEYDTVLAIGNDFNPEHPDRQESVNADAILFWLVPTNGGDPILASLPRDLLVVDPCTGEATKLDRTLAGCGEDISGPELVALAVEDYTGIAVDHFAMFGFDAFVEVIDTLGGVQICVDRPVRHGANQLLPEGCSIADGQTALTWMRSRSTQELVDGEWQFVEGVTDVDRTKRQQALMFAMLAKLKEMRSPAALSGLAESVGDAVVLDEIALNGRSDCDGLGHAKPVLVRIRRIVVPTEPVVVSDGSFAVQAVVPFRELLEG